MDPNMVESCSWESKAATASNESLDHEFIAN